MESPLWICAIVIRRTEVGLEFWMKFEPANSRWEFLQFEIKQAETTGSLSTILLQVSTLRTEMLSDTPIAEVAKSRHQSPGVVHVVPFRYLGEGAAASPFRSRWCLAEEADRRIRRKPLQSVIHEVQKKYESALPIFS